MAYVRTMKGRLIDMQGMAEANAHVRAVGAGVAMNARGDKLGERGEVLKTAEQVEAERIAYRRDNPNRVRFAPMSALDSEVFASPADVYRQDPSKITVQTVQSSLIPEDRKVSIPKSKKIVSDD